MKHATYTVPVNNKEVFATPAIDCTPDLVQENRRKIGNYQFKINGIPFQVLRNKTRDELLRKAVQYTNGIKSLLRVQGWDGQTNLSTPPGNNQFSRTIPPYRKELSDNGGELECKPAKEVPIILTGHEPVLYHPGIWIKNHFTHFLSKKMDGIGINIIVDNDACSLGFAHVPVLCEKSAVVEQVALVTGKGDVAYEEIVFDGVEGILRFESDVLRLLGKTAFGVQGTGKREKDTVENMQSAFQGFMRLLVECYRQGCTDMVGLLTAARRSMEEGFGLDNLEIPVSLLCDTEGFYHFLLLILYEAERFAKIHNEKLAEYRVIHKIRSKANPLPDLAVQRNSIELPFWIWKAGGSRERCYLLNEGEAVKITDKTTTLATLKKNCPHEENIYGLKALMNSGVKIRPRAITTTMFSRLFLSDVFIHGIGGAKYDTVTDEIIRAFSGITPPGFITISATLFLPFETYGVNTKTVQEFYHAMNDIRYNPERYASQEIKNSTAFVNMAQEKQRLLEKMSSGDAEERGRCFYQMKELNTKLLNLISTELQEKQRDIEAINERLAYNKVARFREYPICMFPRQVLEEYFLHVFFCKQDNRILP